MIAAAVTAPAPEVSLPGPAEAAWEATLTLPPDVPAAAMEEEVPAPPATAAGTVDMAAGWYTTHGEGASARQGGPYSWEELVGCARDGRLAEGDLVWHESYAGWVPPAQVPGLKSM